MKKLILAAVCVLAQAAAGLFLAAQAESAYTLSAVYLENEQALSVNMSVGYTNDTGQSLNSVWFNMYSNLFRRESTLPYDNETLTKAFPYGYAPSGIELTKVSFNGEKAKYRFMGTGEYCLSVDCALEDGESGLFYFEYTLLLSENRAFQGCGEDIRLIMFYPSVCVWDGGFVSEPPSRAAEFMYDEKSDFYMRIMLPRGYEIASGAEISHVGASGDMEVYDLSLKGASELSLVMSRRFYTYECELPSGHIIRVLGNDRSKCKSALDALREAAEIYEDWFGALEFSKTDVVFASSAMSYSLPGLIVLSGDEDDTYIKYLYARQYFGCELLTDPRTDPFLSHGVSYYLALLATEEARGENELTKQMRAYVQPALKMTVPGSLTPDSALSRFNTVYDFDVVVRKRGAAVMHELRLVMGRESFISALRGYLEAGQEGLANIEDFVSALSDRGGQGMGNALIAWLMTIDDYISQDGDIY